MTSKTTRRKLRTMEKEANDRFERDAQAKLAFQRKLSVEASEEYKRKQKEKRRKKKV